MIHHNLVVISWGRGIYHFGNYRSWTKYIPIFPNTTSKNETKQDRHEKDRQSIDGKSELTRRSAMETLFLDEAFPKLGIPAWGPLE